MTVQELKERLTALGSHFFDWHTMRFFGDTMKNYGVVETTIIDYDGNEHGVYKLFRRRPVKHGLRQPAYFDKVTFKSVHEKETQ